MFHSRPPVALTLLVALVSLLAMPARGQERIPQDVIVATTGFSEEQRQALSRYVTRWAGLLREATTNPDVSDSQVSEARQRLLSPIRTPGATDFFKRRYSIAVSEAVAPLMDTDRLIVRLNVMIIVTRLTDQAAVALAEKGITDASPSVRYWAAQGIRSLAEATDTQGNPILEVRVRLALLRTLEQAGAEEDSTEVLQQVMLAMVAMDVPSAPDRVLDLLNARLKWHVDRPYEPYLAESAGLRATYQKMLRAGGANPAQVRKLAAIANRYMNLISRNLADAADQSRADGSVNPISRELEADHTTMLELTEFVLQYCHAELRSSEQQPESIIQKIPFRQWRAINLIAVDGWGRVLRAAPFSMQPGELAIVAP